MATYHSLKSSVIFICEYDLVLAILNCLVFVVLVFVVPSYFTLAVLLRAVVLALPKAAAGVVLWRKNYDEVWKKSKFGVNAIFLGVQAVLDVGISTWGWYEPDDKKLKAGLSIGLFLCFVFLWLVDLIFLKVLYRFAKTENEAPKRVDVVKVIVKEMEKVRLFEEKEEKIKKDKEAREWRDRGEFDNIDIKSNQSNENGRVERQSTGKKMIDQEQPEIIQHSSERNIKPKNK
ncbi:unnamed protein product [Moneuplotes crassus]|uniref:Uncharacterized protein n=2 Tax=Euplotes crassus TaxID=5936 RepID=A0AAD2D3V6_EUPCR|nr:unnamed protein product [Moneuplotes crassus]